MYKIKHQALLNAKFNEKLSLDNPPEFIKKFFSTLSSSNTKIDYWITIKDFLFYTFGEIHNINKNDMRKLDYVDAIKYLDNISEYAKQSTLLTKKNQLSSFCSYMVKINITKRNIVDDIPKSKYKCKVIKDSTKMPLEEDVRMLHDVFENMPNELSRLRNSTIFNLVSTLGIRENEIVNLNVDDLNLETEYPNLVLLRKGSYRIEEKEKVLLTSTNVFYIKKWLEYRNNATQKTNALFITRNGERMRGDSLTKTYKKYSDGKITFHMLRHYAATKLTKLTGDIAFVQEQIGHRVGSTITLDTYVAGTVESKKMMLEL